MGDMIPGPWEGLLLALAAFRLVRLVGWDTVTEPIRNRITRLGGWQEGDDYPEGYRPSWAKWLTCPWCQGFWVCVLVWTAWWFAPDWTLALSVPLALSSFVGLVAKNLDP